MVKAKISKDDFLKLERFPRLKTFFNLNEVSGKEVSLTDKELKRVKDTCKRMENVLIMLEKKFKEEN